VALPSSFKENHANTLFKIRLKNSNPVQDIPVPDLQSCCLLHTYKILYEIRYGRVKIFLSFIGKETKGRWPGLGNPLPDSGHYGSLESLDRPYYRPYVVASSTPVTHDTVCLVLRPSNKNGHQNYLRVRAGQHVQFRRTVQLKDGGGESSFDLIRSYTPVPVQFTPDGKEKQATASTGDLYFLIKIYPNGALTPALGLLRTGDTIDISDPSGDFILSPVIGNAQNKEVVLNMLAAGTGITPMFSILPTVRQKIAAANGCPHRVVLLYFNRTQRDIIGRAELERFAAKNSWLEITHVLSDEEDESWVGPRGRVRKELLAEHIGSEVGEARCIGYRTVPHFFKIKNGTHRPSMCKVIEVEFSNLILSYVNFNIM
jgi:cytochrome-b5 reductase